MKLFLILFKCVVGKIINLLCLSVQIMFIYVIFLLVIRNFFLQYFQNLINDLTNVYALGFESILIFLSKNHSPKFRLNMYD